MGYKFKKQIFGWMDLLRFKKLVPNREKHLSEGSEKPLPTSYKVNEVAAILHPGLQKATLTAIKEETKDTKAYTFELSLPMLFRAGQYVTLRKKIGDSLVNRPYGVASSPLESLHNKSLTLMIKKAGFFSDYLFDNAKVGDEFEIEGPSGFFYYEPLTDKKEVIAVAGGSGITPFLAMAKAIVEGQENFHMTLLYGANKEEELIAKDELDKLPKDKIKVVYVLANEEKKGYEHGFISAELINKYAPESYTLMFCGSDGMGKFLNGELKKLKGLHNFKSEKNAVGMRDVKPATYKLTVHINDQVYEVKASNNETLLVSMERAGLSVPSSCRAGGCGFCHSKLVSGKFSIAGADKRRLADVKFGYIHPCVTYPDSDMEIIVPQAK